MPVNTNSASIRRSSGSTSVGMASTMAFTCSGVRASRVFFPVEGIVMRLLTAGSKGMSLSSKADAMICLNRISMEWTVL